MKKFDKNIEETKVDNKDSMDSFNLKLNALLKDKKKIAIIVLSFLLLITWATYPNNSASEDKIKDLESQIEILSSSNDKILSETEQKNSAKINELENTIKTLQQEKEQLTTEKNNLQNQNNELTNKVEDLQKKSSETTSSSNPPSSSTPTSSPNNNSKSTNNTSTSSTYILNTNTKKFHKPSCGSVSQIKESNKQSSSSSRDQLISQGYEPCKKCNP